VEEEDGGGESLAERERERGEKGGFV